MLLLCDCNETDVLSIYTLWQALELLLAIETASFPGGAAVLERQDANRIAIGKGLYQIAAEKHFPSVIIHQVQSLRGPFLFHGDMVCSHSIFLLCVVVHAHVGQVLSLAGCSSEECWVIWRDLLRVSLKIEREGEKNIVPTWLLGITSGRSQIAITDVLNAVSALLTNSLFVLLSTVSISDSLSLKVFCL